MSSTTLIPMFDPEGTLRQVPQDQVRDALAAGGKVGVKMLDPAGKQRWVSHDQVQSAAQAGGKIVPIEQQAVPHAGFWSSLGSGLKDLITPSDSPLMGERSNMALGMDVGRKQEMARTAAAQEQQRKQAGYSQAYRTTAGLAQSIGVNAAPMEQAAAQGDTAGVLGHATASAAPYVVGAAVTELSKPGVSGPAEPPMPKGSAVQRGLRSVMGMGEEVMKKQARASLADYATESGRVAQKNADAAATHAKQVAKVEGVNAAGQESLAKRAALNQKVIDDSAALAQAVQQKAQAVRTEGQAKYNVVTQAVGDAGVPSTDIAALVKHAEDNILAGSRPESIKQFRQMLEQGAAPESIASPSFGGSPITPGTPLYESLVERGVIGPSAQTVPFRDMQGFVTELGDRMYGSGVPNDVHAALRYVRDGIKSQMQQIADQHGVGPQLTEAQQFWRRYEQTYNNFRNVTMARGGLGPERIGSPVAKLVRMTDPEVIRSLTTGNVSDRLISMLRAEDPSLGAMAEQIKRDHQQVGTLPKRYTEKPLPEAPEPKAMPLSPDLPSEIQQAREKRVGQVVGKLRSPYALAAELTLTAYSRSLKPLLITVARHGIASVLERPGAIDYLTSITPRDMALLRDLDPALSNPMRQAMTEAYIRKGVPLSQEAKSFLLPAQVAAITAANAARPDNRYTTPQSVMLGMKSGDLTPSEGARLLQKLRRSSSAGPTRRMEQPEAPPPVPQTY